MTEPLPIEDMKAVYRDADGNLRVGTEQLSKSGADMDISERWSEYDCRRCGATTRADTLPSYCPSCGEWGTPQIVHD